MGMALQVMLLVVGIVVAVGGIGLALALRQLSRQRKPAALARRMAHHRAAVPSQAGALAPAASRAMPLDAAKATAASRAAAASPATAAAAAPTAAPAAPLSAHDSKLQALQALLALGDARAEREPVSGFDDTQPVDERYAATQFADRRDNPPSQLSLLNLDKASRRAPGPQARK